MGRKTSKITTDKNTAKKALRQKLYIQAFGSEYSVEDIKKKTLSAIKEAYPSMEILTSNIYYKPEEGKAYCVINDSETLEVVL